MKSTWQWIDCETPHGCLASKFKSAALQQPVLLVRQTCPPGTLSLYRSSKEIGGVQELFYLSGQPVYFKVKPKMKSPGCQLLSSILSQFYFVHK